MMSSSESLNAIDSSTELQITVTGRKSGRERSTPVWFVREGRTIFLLPVKGSKSEWYRNVLRSKKIKISSGNLSYNLPTKPLTDSKQVAGVVDKFRRKHGAGDVKKYYVGFDVALELSLP